MLKTVLISQCHSYHYSYHPKVYAEHVEEMHIKKCPHFDYTSTRRAHVKWHMYRHTGEKPHTCPYCDYRSITSTNMKSHINDQDATPQSVSVI